MTSTPQMRNWLVHFQQSRPSIHRSVTLNYLFGRSPNPSVHLAHEDAHNNSLDASGISGLVIDNLSVAWLFPAASTQTLGCSWYRTGSGSDRVKHSTFGTTRKSYAPMFRRFQREHLSTHAVSGWIPSLPLRVLYRTLYSQWRNPNRWTRAELAGISSITCP